MARRTNFCRNVQQNTARNARIINIMVICRTFMRSVLRARFKTLSATHIEDKGQPTSD